MTIPDYCCGSALALRAGTVFVAALCVPAPAFAQTPAPSWPTKSIRCIIPTAPGGGSEPIARMIGQRFTQAWGQQVVVDHRPGAGQTIGIDLVAKSSPDGHTIAVVNPSHAINATLMAKLPYDPVRDLAVITVLATQPYAMVFTQSFAPKNVKELIAAAKAKPRELVFVSSGPGSASHLAAEMFVNMAGIEMTHIPYKGTGSLMPDLIAGRVPMMINPVLAMINQVNAGRLRLIAVTSSKRLSTLPDTPTIAETVPGYEAISWYAMIAPAKTPPAVIAKLHAETVRALKSPEIADTMAKAGADALGNTPREAEAFVKLEIERWGKVIRQAKVRIE
jgi:tripartite-type tricarboxylate transporter receptor subunit TctC